MVLNANIQFFAKYLTSTYLSKGQITEMQLLHYTYICYVHLYSYYIKYNFEV